MVSFHNNKIKKNHFICFLLAKKKRNAKTWKQIQKLSSHQLTITQMKFSPNNRYLLSVGRDRKISVFERTVTDDGNDEIPFKLIACTDKTNGIHTRIIWTCDWTHDSEIFATGSRDGKLVAWHKSPEIATTSTSLASFKSMCTLDLKNDSITAIAFAHKFYSDCYLAAIGFETGQIQIYYLSTDNWNFMINIDQE